MTLDTNLSQVNVGHVDLSYTDANCRLVDNFVFNVHRCGGPQADTDGKKNVGGASGNKQKTGVCWWYCMHVICDAL